jgi:hypothetical protein
MFLRFGCAASLAVSLRLIATYFAGQEQVNPPAKPYSEPCCRRVQLLPYDPP